jgi:ubiquitin carboxyl-terminal hydrolase 4/11/15
MPFVRHFLRGGWEAEINLQNKLGTQGKVARSFASVVEEAWRGSSGVIDPYELKLEISTFAPQFQGWAQQDSHELMTFLLDAIHEDLNRCLRKQIVEAVVGDATNDEETAIAAWQNHRARNDSIVVDLFHGQLRSRLVCPNPDCGRTTVVFDPYVAVQLPIQKATRDRTRPVGVKFVPLDFASPPVPLTLLLPPKPTPECVSAAVSAAIGRDVHAVLGLKTYNGVTWDLHKLHSDDEADFRWNEPWAFEIDDLDRLWVPASLKMGKRTTYNTVYDETVLGPFLLPLDDDRDLARAADARLAWLWPGAAEAERPPLSREASDLKNQIVIPDGDPSTDEPRLKVTTWSSVTQSFKHAYVSDTSATVELKPAAFAPDAGFDLDGLVTVAATFSSVAVPEVGGSSTSSAVTLEDCFAHFSESEVLDEANQWFCPHCRQHVCASKTMDIWSVPRILVVQLKRFVTARYQTKKLNTTIAYPDQLDMAPFVAGPQRNAPALYRLYAVSEHSGSLGGGHYTAHALVQDGGNAQWFDFNDSTAWQAQPGDAHSPQAYLLFYESAAGVEEPLPARMPVAGPADADSDDSSGPMDVLPGSEAGLGNENTGSSDEGDLVRVRGADAL